jgi:hypothetical protein
MVTKGRQSRRWQPNCGARRCHQIHGLIRNPILGSIFSPTIVLLAEREMSAARHGIRGSCSKSRFDHGDLPLARSHGFPPGGSSCGLLTGPGVDPGSGE